MTDRLPNSDFQGRISQLGSSNLEEINGVYNPRELFVDTRNWVLSVHDGQTPGGHPIARADLSNVAHDDLVSSLNNVPVEAINFNQWNGTYFGNGGNDLLAGSNPQLAKATLGAAISLGSSNELLCNDSSIITLSSLDGKQVLAPNATFVVSSDVTFSNGATLVCRQLIGSGGKITLNAGCKIIVNGAITGSKFITGSGEVVLATYSSPCFTNEFTGKYSVLNYQLPLYAPSALTSVQLEGNGVITCDGGPVTITDYMNPLVAQMKAYINSGGITGVKTKTTAQTANGTQLGDYFIYNIGATTFRKPLMYNGYSTGLPNYNTQLYAGALPTSYTSYNQNAIIYAYAAGRGGSTSTIYIQSPNGSVTRSMWWYAHHSGSSSGQSFGTFILPRGWKVRFEHSNLNYRNYMNVFGMNMDSANLYYSMRIF